MSRSGSARVPPGCASFSPSRSRPSSSSPRSARTATISRIPDSAVDYTSDSASRRRRHQRRRDAASVRRRDTQHDARGVEGDAAAVCEHVYFTVRVLPETKQREVERVAVRELQLADGAAVHAAEPHDVTLVEIEESSIGLERAREVAEDVAADELRDARAAVDEAADHRQA